MKVFVDTNIILDVMLRRAGFYEASRAIFDLAESGSIIAYVSAVSITDIFYILHKYKQDSATVYAPMDDIAALFSITSVTENTIVKALSLRWKDFEDAVQYTSACETGAEYVVTRNKSDFEISTNGIPCVNPVEFMTLFTKSDKQ